jgi:7-carboxy-7-deazaguanine synthase
LIYSLPGVIIDHMTPTQTTLPIAEDFYSVQCEGITTGKPAYFIRLKGCNLTCGASPAFIKQIQSQGKGNIDSGSFVGDLHQEDKASWTCDSIPVWLFGEAQPFDYLTTKWKSHTMPNGKSMLEWIKHRYIHLIWTGGEPAMHQKKIEAFLDSLLGEGVLPYNEIETNGTLVLEDNFLDHLSQINCSLKLSNSGMAKQKRLNGDAIKSVQKHWNHWFKFVISTEDDIQEFIKEVCEPYDIDMANVVCMPGLDCREDFHERTQFVLEMAKKYGFHGLTRLHISAWDKTTSV